MTRATLSPTLAITAAASASSHDLPTTRYTMSIAMVAVAVTIVITRSPRHNGSDQYARKFIPTPHMPAPSAGYRSEFATTAREKRTLHLVGREVKGSGPRTIRLVPAAELIEQIRLGRWQVLVPIKVSVAL